MIPTRIGQHFEGGYLAGVIQIRDRAHLVLVAPKSTEGSIPFKTHCSGTPNTQLVNDGWANTNAMNDNAHPAAQYCRSLTVGGHTDLYLPSCDELELCYRGFKPTDQVNVTSPTCSYAGNLRLANGSNRNSIPTGSAYTETNPARTIVTSFQTGSVERHLILIVITGLVRSLPLTRTARRFRPFPMVTSTGTTRLACTE